MTFTRPLLALLLTGSTLLAHAAGPLEKPECIPPAKPGGGFALTDATTANMLGFQAQAIDIYNNSWGPSDNGQVLGGVGALTLAALQNLPEIDRAALLMRADDGLAYEEIAAALASIRGTISGTVTDTGGMMSHAAIVCREYGMPAVTGTGTASVEITTGQRLRVDGTTGTVTILD